MYTTEVVFLIQFTEVLAVCISGINYCQYDPSVSVLWINEH